MKQQLKDLVEEWDSIKQSKLRISIRGRSPSSSSTTGTGSSIMVKTLQLLDNASPRSLMSSLQQSDSSSSSDDDGDVDDDELGGTWKVRTNELAVQEILRDRREAIESGKLKGRRLFVDDDEEESFQGRSEEFWNQDYDCEVRSSNYDDSDQAEEEILFDGSEHELPVVFCQYCSSSYSSSNSIPPRKAAKVVADQVEEKSGGVSVRSRWMVVLGWFSIVALIVCAVGITISIMPMSIRRSFYVYIRDQNEVILVPT